MSIIDIYKDQFANIDGYFIEPAQHLWAFFLGVQNNWGIRGDFVEIGVWRGKSATLGALHLSSEETCILIDINNVDDTIDRIKGLDRPKVRYFTGNSSKFQFDPLFDQHKGKVRFFHVDGDHSGFGTLGDIIIASQMIAHRGLICVDDFGNMRYPQLMAAVYRFLFYNPLWVMITVGANKCFITRVEDSRFYLDQILTTLPNYIAEHCPKYRVAKTSYLHDWGCFSLELKTDEMILIGRDEDALDIVF